MEILTLPIGNLSFKKFSFNKSFQSESKLQSKQKGNLGKETDSEDYLTINKDQYKVEKIEKEPVSMEIESKAKEASSIKENCDNENGDKSKAKKKKWKKLELSELGFQISLFPRPVKNNAEIDRDSAKLWAEIENECEYNEKITLDFRNMVELEGKIQGNVKQLRRDRTKRVQKAHKQVKTKHCKSVLNNKGRKPLYVKHRVYKMMELDIHRLSYMPSPKREKNIVKREIARGNTVTPISNRPGTNNNYRPTPVQCLAHTIHKDNLPNDLDAALANLLMNMQHRDLTPEDYDLLLQLDEARVKPKTMSENKLNTFKTDIVDSNDNLEVCPICMDLYEKGQERKYLPCNHAFHSKCIDSWLKNSSMNCPIDNLPIDS